MATSSTAKTPAPVLVICSTCGGEHVTLDAWAGWNSRTQAWELAQTFDYSYCHDCDGECRIYTEKEQRAVIANYYTALRNVFPEEYRKTDSVFFRTVGFGALWNAFPVVFNLSLKEYQGFQVKDVTRVFKRIESFDFTGWRSFGTGTAAETQAGNDIMAALRSAFTENEVTSQLRV